MVPKNNVNLELLKVISFSNVYATEQSIITVIQFIEVMI